MPPATIALTTIASGPDNFLYIHVDRLSFSLQGQSYPRGDNMRILKIASVAVAGFLLSFCASPYKIPEVDQLGSSGPLAFNGIADYLKQGDVRIIWVHGMCDHDSGWAHERRDALYQAIGAAPAPPDDMHYGPGPYSVRSTTYVGSSRLETNYPIWSPLSTAFKDRLRYDDSPPEGRKPAPDEFPYQRASLNRSLKQTLMNRCLIDAVVYSGPNGNPIRDWMKAQICEGLGGAMNSRRCRMPEGGPAPRTVLVAESLGSKVLFDALRSIWDESGRSGRAAEQLASVQSVFLLANQIPLLDAADRPATAIRKATVTGSQELDFLSVLSQARTAPTLKARAVLPDLQVIAFTDPNDLLSYRLSGKGLHSDRVKVINVIVSNAPTYLGLFEMPDAAHCGYKWNRHVVGAVAFGYHDGIRPLAYSLPAECGMVGKS